MDTSLDNAFCRWVACRVFERAYRDLRNDRCSEDARNARAFLVSEDAAFMAGALGYSTAAPRLLVERLEQGNG